MNSKARGIFSQERPTRPLRPMHFGCLFWNDLYLQKQVIQFKWLIYVTLLVTVTYGFVFAWRWIELYSVRIVMFIKALCVAYHFI